MAIKAFYLKKKEILRLNDIQDKHDSLLDRQIKEL